MSSILSFLGLNYDRKPSGGSAPSAAAAAASPDAKSGGDTKVVAAPKPPVISDYHLFVLCHGLHGGPDDLAYLSNQISEALPGMYARPVRSFIV